MKVFFTFLLLSIALFANDEHANLDEVQSINTSKSSICQFKIECCNNELKILGYQNQLIDLHKTISDIDTKNELLKAKLAENERYYEKILDNQALEFSVQLKQNQENHDVVIDDLFYMFKIIIGLITAGIVLVGFGLNFLGRRLLNKAIGKEIRKKFTAEITSQQIDKLKESPEFNTFIKDIIEESKAGDEDTVTDPIE